MNHPEISHLDDVLPHIEGRPEFHHTHKDGYSVVDYTHVADDSFDDPVRLECRGLKFDTRGFLIARPLHKFHNVGEKPHTMPGALDFSQAHVITTKMDGSMIHPALLDGKVVFMTRGGRTDHAVRAERHLTPALEMEIRNLLERELTPIFEWTAPDNRIVVRYEQSGLTLLAIRHNLTGAYEPHGRLATSIVNIPTVDHHPSDWNDPVAFVAHARAMAGVEGFVVRFANGLWVKAKGDDYVLKHRAKESITQEKNILALVLNDQVDDLLPLLEEADQSDVIAYRDAVNRGIAGTAQALSRHVRWGSHLDQKEFAVQHQPLISKSLQPLAYQIRAGRDPEDAVRGHLLKNLSSQTAVDSGRHLHGATLQGTALQGATLH